MSSSATDRPGLVEVTMPEGGDEAEVKAWRKRPGERVAENEPICLVDVNGFHAEVISPTAGTVARLLVGVAARVASGQPLAEIAPEVEAQEEEAEAVSAPSGELSRLERSDAPPDPAPRPERTPIVVPRPEPQIPEPEPEPVAVEPEPVAVEPEPEPVAVEPEPVAVDPEPELAPPLPEPVEVTLAAPRPEPAPVDMSAFRSPAVRRLAALHDVDLDGIAGTGRDGRVTKWDIEQLIDESRLKRRPVGIESL